MSDSTLLPEWGGSLVVGEDNIRLPTVAEQTYGQVFNTILDSSVYNYWLQQLSKKVNYSLSSGISQWNITTNYVVDDVVTYSGGIYMSKVNNNTALPTDSTKWSLFQTLDFASEAEAIARTETNKWMNPFVTGKLIDNELIGQTPSNAINLGDVDLASINEAGFYWQGETLKATLARNYPLDGGRGTLLVEPWYGSTAIGYDNFTYKTLTSKQIFVASTNNGIFSGWTEIGGTNTDTLNPVGSGIISYDGEVFTGYIPAEGQAVLRSLYPLLFAKWGTKYGAGDGSTTFNVIDMRGLFARGQGGASAGFNVVQDDAIRNITGQNTFEHMSYYSSSGAFVTTLGANSNYGANQPGGNKFVNTFDASRQVPIAGENRPINRAVRYLIKAS